MANRPGQLSAYDHPEPKITPMELPVPADMNRTGRGRLGLMVVGRRVLWVR
jgi:hypothetical protein